MMVTMMTKITTWLMMIHMAMCTVGVMMCKYNAQFGLHRSDNHRRAANRGHGLEISSYMLGEYYIIHDIY
jgi:hypothetical protein